MLQQLMLMLAQPMLLPSQIEMRALNQRSKRLKLGHKVMLTKPMKKSLDKQLVTLMLASLMLTMTMMPIQAWLSSRKCAIGCSHL